MTSFDDFTSKIFKKWNSLILYKNYSYIMYVKLIQFHGQILKSNNKCVMLNDMI